MASAVGADSVRLSWVSVSFPPPGSQAGSSLGSVKHCSSPLHSISAGLGGAEAAAEGLEAVHGKAQVWRRSEQIPTLMKPPDVFLWDGALCAMPWESAVAEYAKSVGKEFVELVLPHISSCKASRLRCAHFQHLLLKNWKDP